MNNWLSPTGEEADDEQILIANAYELKQSNEVYTSEQRQKIKFNNEFTDDVNNDVINLDEWN